MDLESIKKALMKNPDKWAQMHLETQRLLDLATTELTLYNKEAQERPQGMFDSVRAMSLLSLLNVMSSQMFDAFIVERDGENTASIGKTANDDDLHKLQVSLEGTLALVKEYRSLKGSTPNSEVSRSLVQNNPCNVQMVDSRTGHTIMRFDSVEQGLANTMQVVKWVHSDIGPNCTYERFFEKWFENYVKKDEMLAKAVKEVAKVRQPDGIILRTAANYIVLTEILTTIEYDKPIDREYINKHYTLDKYVTAVMTDAPDVRAV